MVLSSDILVVFIVEFSLVKFLSTQTSARIAFGTANRNSKTFMGLESPSEIWDLGWQIEVAVACTGQPNWFFQSFERPPCLVNGLKDPAPTCSTGEPLAEKPGCHDATGASAPHPLLAQASVLFLHRSTCPKACPRRDSSDGFFPQQFEMPRVWSRRSSRSG